MTRRSGAPSRRSGDRDLLPFQLLMGVTAGGIGGIVTVLGELRDEFGFSGTGIGIMVASGFVAAFVPPLRSGAAAAIVQARDRFAGVVTDRGSLAWGSCSGRP